MTGAVQKFCAFGAAIALCLGLLIALHLHNAYAQDEPEPEASPMEEPQAEPTEWVPITAGDAARGAPVAGSDASPSPASENTAVEASTPVAVPSPAAVSSPASVQIPAKSPWHTTIGREPAPKAAAPAIKEAAPSTASTDVSTPPAASSVGANSETKRNGSKGGNAPDIVPENSPFAGMGFSKQKGPTNIASDTMTLDDRSKFLLYSGHVHAVQAGGDLTTDALKLQYGQNFNDIRMIYADGNVRMSQGTRWITSDHAVLDQSKHILTFHGDPVVHDGEDQITGSLITVDLVTGKSTVQNPRVVIFPRDSKNPDNGVAPDSP